MTGGKGENNIGAWTILSRSVGNGGSTFFGRWGGEAGGVRRLRKYWGGSILLEIANGEIKG